MKYLLLLFISFILLCKNVEAQTCSLTTSSPTATCNLCSTSPTVYLGNTSPTPSAQTASLFTASAGAVSMGGAQGSTVNVGTTSSPTVTNLVNIGGVGSTTSFLGNVFFPATRVNLTIITATGAGTYTTKTGCKALYVTVIAGGGAGSYSSQGTDGISAGGGGGGGGYTTKFIMSPAATYSYTVGTGGVVAEVSPGNGTTSYFGSVMCFGGGAAVASSSPLLSAAGQAYFVRGNNNNYATQGNPGTCQGGDFISAATRGTPGFVSGSSATPYGAAMASGGMGGGNPMFPLPGMFEYTITNGCGSSGAPSDNTGRGGHGGVCAVSGRAAGTNGASGLIVVWEYY